MRNYIIRLLVNYYCAKALKYEQQREMLLKPSGVRFIYAVGCNVWNRDKCFNIIEKLQRKINPNN